MPDWNLLISSATIIAICAFLVRFFGGTISDQLPYSDDQKWNVDVAGVSFFVRILLFWSIVGYAVAYYFRIPLNDRWSLYSAFSILSLLVLWLHFTNRALGQKYYNLKTWIKFKPLPQNLVNILVALITRLNRFIPSPLIVIVASYTLTNLYFSGHPIWFYLGVIEAFSCAWFLALRESYLIIKDPTLATIYLIDGGRLEDVYLLKVNPSNVRLREGEKIKIINSAQIKLIEVRRNK